MGIISPSQGVMTLHGKMGLPVLLGLQMVARYKNFLSTTGIVGPQMTPTTCSRCTQLSNEPSDVKIGHHVAELCHILCLALSITSQQTAHVAKVCQDGFSLVANQFQCFKDTNDIIDKNQRRLWV